VLSSSLEGTSGPLAPTAESQRRGALSSAMEGLGEAGSSGGVKLGGSDGKLVGGISVFSLHPISRQRAPPVSVSARAVGVRTHPHAVPVSELVLVHARAAGWRARSLVPLVSELVRPRHRLTSLSARAVGVRARPRATPVDELVCACR
jgi:hypothetical protein